MGQAFSLWAGSFGSSVFSPYLNASSLPASKATLQNRSLSNAVLKGKCYHVRLKEFLACFISSFQFFMICGVKVGQAVGRRETWSSHCCFAERGSGQQRSTNSPWHQGAGSERGRVLPCIWTLSGAVSCPPVMTQSGVRSAQKDISIVSVGATEVKAAVARGTPWCKAGRWFKGRGSSALSIYLSLFRQQQPLQWRLEAAG